MTHLDQTDVLPRPPETEDPEPARPRWGLLIVALAGLLLILVASLGVIAETVARAEVQRIGVEEVRARLDAPASERIEVDIAGSVLLQELVGRYDRIGVTVYSFPTGRANADLTMTIEGLGGSTMPSWPTTSPARSPSPRLRPRRSSSRRTRRAR